MFTSLQHCHSELSEECAFFHAGEIFCTAVRASHSEQSELSLFSYGYRKTGGEMCNLFFDGKTNNGREKSILFSYGIRTTDNG